ncbi:asparagine synthetase B [Elstera cyanobacteriorum]|uniref:asparagine synthase (glutamine-hydrolyzing) n=1 Tax=Elstera cyanobacteriorum TaxID=2022747 RepID=A0A255XTT3_9PROT|nr:asparagine synthase (glutamine-hydrolyzing) [Elstera cyanobacteriorum]OYQ20409.1 asparagine synthase (glutamine-hydrolyzing) [Elstera cyanobacteriorum]GFZ98964.1 asparagine synthetase B [Elstera cyanobacteriorum]
MCGIAGIMRRGGAPADRAIVQRMIDALAHRGPDGEGIHLQGAVALAHRRLSIIDLQTGDQPFHDPAGNTLIGNGEVYNYIELRADLAGQVTFTTTSDCEPPLHLFRRQGLAYADRLRGMYALAIAAADGRLVLTRDPFGIKPLYYAEVAEGLIFASEPQALFASGWIAPRLNPRARDELLQMQFTTGAETMFEGVFRLLPGETLVAVDGRVTERNRRAALPDGGPETIDEATALDRLDQALADSVRVHCRSDVPYGLFLSGGIDSALVLSYMRDVHPGPVQCFTVGFDGAAADERAAARAVAAACGAEFNEVGFGAREFWALLPRVAVAMDDPAADYATLPTFLLAQTARQSLKVVLTGEGGDEIFGGYGRYRSVMRPWWLGGKVLRGKGTFARLGVLRNEGGAWRDGIATAEIHAATQGRTRLQTAQAVDCTDWLPHDLLTKLDRCLMRNGMEGRTPFLDPAVVAAGFRLPDTLKVRDGKGKWILRRLLEKRLPQADALGRKKGFTVPVGAWLTAEGARLGPLLARQPCLAEIARPERVAALAHSKEKHAGFALWSLLFYALWHRAQIERAPMDGSVWELLAG